jgi:hypothetical protein
MASKMSHRTGAVHRHAVQRSTAEAIPFPTLFGENPPADSLPKWTYWILLAAVLESTSTKAGAGLDFLATGQVMKIMTRIEGRLHSACPSNSDRRSVLRY